MAYRHHLRGLGSGAEYPVDAIMNLCPVDGRPVEIVLDLERLKAERGPDGGYRPDRLSMWRFGGLLAMDPDDPEDARHIVSLGEGATPLIDVDDHALARRAGFRLQLKDEGRPWPGHGANPTGSFKDRGMAMVVSRARSLGLGKLAVPTQGNAGDSLVRYALAAGLSAAVVMPDDTPMAIQGNVAAMGARHDEIRLELVTGTIREAGVRIKERWVPEGWFSVATFQDPGWRIEGKKTLGLELAEPPRGETRWSLPDVIVYPTGGGTGVLGMWKAFDELEALGLVGAGRPRMVAVQSEATAPLVDAFHSGADDTSAGAVGHTMATGLNVPVGVGHFRVLEILRASGGTALTVGEDAMGEIMGRALRERGWWLAPEGAACLAALERLVDEGVVGRGDRVVAVNTGSFEKYLPDVRPWLLGGESADG